ncbi:MAG: T9SS type A sorting domain-containing protein [Flavobacteriales bacterium]|nr:MAG: T9SS type A sorting domain-containing protein [Flavobacteriales bacterium]
MSISRIMRLLALLVTLHVAQVTWPQAPFDLDLSFRTGLNVRYVSSIAELSNGDVLLSGVLRWPGDQFDRGYVRVTASGHRVLPFPDFAPGGGRITPWNSRYYIGNGPGVRRIFEDGTVDTGYILPSAGPYVFALQGGDYHVYPDGRVLMSGAHVLTDSIRGFEGLYSLIWFTNTGYLDTTRTHRLCNGVIYAIEEQPDGKFLCTGTMTTYEGQPVNRVFRVEPDGELDTTFNTPLQPYGGPRDYHILPDGRILLGGVARLNGSDITRCLVRIKPNGDVDETFELNTFEATFTPNNSPSVLEILQISPDRFIITGVFDKINGVDRGGIAMFDSSGALVEDVFDGLGCGEYEYVVSSGSTTYKYIAGIVPAPDGSFYIHGGYHGYDDGTTNDTTQRMVSRLYGLEVGVREEKAMTLGVYPNPSSRGFTVRLSHPPKNGTLYLLDALGRSVRTWNWSNGALEASFDTNGLSGGRYFVLLKAEDRSIHSSLILSP